MIISASRRTDIPAFYSDWFFSRAAAGHVLTRNPMNAAQVYKIPLSPDTTDCIVFWTKNAAPMLPRLPELDRSGYMYYFQFTLTPYGPELEPGLPEKEQILETFARLSEMLGKKRVLWRYDPIIVNDFYTVDRHKSRFLELCQKLSGHTERVTVSFVDMYPKIKSPLLRPVTEGEKAELCGFIGRTAVEFGIAPAACCEAGLPPDCGIGPAACIDRELIGELLGAPLDLSRDKNQRPGCGCAESVDIGAYGTCPAGCVYCYANRGQTAPRRAYAAHDPASPILKGSIGDSEIIDRAAKSHKQAQTELF